MGRSQKKSLRKVSVTVVLLERYQKNVPRNADKKMLQDEGKYKKVFFTRADSPKEVKAKISWAFKTADLAADTFSYLECTSSGSKLILSSNQLMNGNDAIERRGCLYICKTRDDNEMTLEVRKAGYKNF